MSDRVSLPHLLTERENRAAALKQSLEAAQREGRSEMNALEMRVSEEIQRIDEHIADLRNDEARGALPPSLARISGDPSTRTTRMTDDQHLTYRRHGRESWIRDLIAAQTDYGDDPHAARQRLARHADEVRTNPSYLEYRDLSRTDGQGGYGVPPAWLMDLYTELARPDRAFANLCQRLPLPGGTDSINIPKVLTGTTVGIQVADNTAVEETDLTDTFINAPVRTLAGQQSVSMQLLDQSPISFDEVIFKDLAGAHAAAADQQVMSGTGSNGQVLGIDYTAGIHTIAVGSVDIAGVYKSIANAIQKVHTTRFRPPEVIVMHPRRWGWFLSLLDTTNRPLFLAPANNPQNAGGILTAVDSQQVVGQMHGLPVVTDPLVTVTNGSGSPTGSEDVIYVARTSDLLLWESGIRARVLPETKAETLTCVLQLWSYLAFSAARQPQSVAVITGLTAPTW